jgi:hypothetical protein
MFLSESDRTTGRMRLQRFMISLPRFDNQRLIFHAARQTLRKAEMARLVLHEWLNQHDAELEDWKARTASELGISVSELEQQLLLESQVQSRTKSQEGETREDDMDT